jgi:signal transduction protein with GAF and PtsI domain
MKTSIVTLLALALAPAARAQDSGGGAASTTTTLLIVGLPLTTVGGIVTSVTNGMTNMAESSTSRNRAEISERDARIAEAFLRERASDLREGLCTGLGPAMDDLAAALKIKKEHRRRFGAALRARRVELAALADPAGLDTERARDFLVRLGEILRADASLRNDVAG